MESSKVFFCQMMFVATCLSEVECPRGTCIDGKATESNLQKNMRKHGQC